MARMEQVLASASREQNARLVAKLAHTMHVSKHAADLEAARIAALSKATEQVAIEATLANARDEALELYHQLQAELSHVQL